MPGYYINETLYQNCEIHSSLVTGSGPRAGSIWPYNENIFYLLKSSLLPKYLRKLNI